MIKRIIIKPNTFAEGIIPFKSINLRDLIDSNKVFFYGDDPGNAIILQAIYFACLRGSNNRDLEKLLKDFIELEDKQSSPSIEMDDIGVSVEFDDDDTLNRIIYIGKDNNKCCKQILDSQDYSPIISGPKEENELTLILLDDIDSWLKGDNIEEVMNKIDSILKHRGNEVQVLVSGSKTKYLGYFNGLITLDSEAYQTITAPRSRGEFILEGQKDGQAKVYRKIGTGLCTVTGGYLE